MHEEFKGTERGKWYKRDPRKGKETNYFQVFLEIRYWQFF